MRISDWSSDVCSSDLTITVSGSGRADLYVFQDQDDCNDWDDAEDSHTGNANPKVVTIHADGDGAVWFRIYNSSNNNATGSLTYTANAHGWVDMTPKGNTSALQQAELQNFANWYPYHRTRQKMRSAEQTNELQSLKRIPYA